MFPNSLFYLFLIFPFQVSIGRHWLRRTWWLLETRSFLNSGLSPETIAKNGGLIVGIWKFHVSWAHVRRWLVRYSEVRKLFKAKNMSWFLLEFICTKLTTIDGERTTIAVYFSLSLSLCSTISFITIPHIHVQQIKLIDWLQAWSEKHYALIPVSLHVCEDTTDAILLLCISSFLISVVCRGLSMERVIASFLKIHCVTSDPSSISLVLVINTTDQEEVIMNDINGWGFCDIWNYQGPWFFRISRIQNPIIVLINMYLKNLTTNRHALHTTLFYIVLGNHTLRTQPWD